VIDRPRHFQKCHSLFSASGVGARVGPIVDTLVTGAEVEIGAPVGPLVGASVTGETTGAGVVGAKVGAEVGFSIGTGVTAA
jgi:hypothetical protein